MASLYRSRENGVTYVAIEDRYWKREGVPASTAWRGRKIGDTLFQISKVTPELLASFRGEARVTEDPTQLTYCEIEVDSVGRLTAIAT